MGRCFWILIFVHSAISVWFFYFQETWYEGGKLWGWRGRDAVDHREPYLIFQRLWTLSVGSRELKIEGVCVWGVDPPGGFVRDGSEGDEALELGRSWGDCCGHLSERMTSEQVSAVKKYLESKIGSALGNWLALENVGEGGTPGWCISFYLWWCPRWDATGG